MVIASFTCTLLAACKYRALAHALSNTACALHQHPSVYRLQQICAAGTCEYPADVEARGNMLWINATADKTDPHRAESNHASRQRTVLLPANHFEVNSYRACPSSASADFTVLRCCPPCVCACSSWNHFHPTSEQHEPTQTRMSSSLECDARSKTSIANDRTYVHRGSLTASGVKRTRPVPDSRG